jgi:hypothetical protein
LRALAHHRRPAVVRTTRTVSALRPASNGSVCSWTRAVPTPGLPRPAQPRTLHPIQAPAPPWVYRARSRRAAARRVRASGSREPSASRTTERATRPARATRNARAAAAPRWTVRRTAFAPTHRIARRRRPFAPRSATHARRRTAAKWVPASDPTAQRVPTTSAAPSATRPASARAAAAWSSVGRATARVARLQGTSACDHPARGRVTWPCVG